MLAQRYNKTPTEVMNSLSTFDMFIMTASIEYEQYQRQQKDPNYVPEVNTDTLLKIWNNR
jgi:hypothetical protein